MIASLTVKVFPLRGKECPSFTSNQLVNNCPLFPACAQVGSSHLSLCNVDLICTYVFTNNQCSILTNTRACNSIHCQRGKKRETWKDGRVINGDAIDREDKCQDVRVLWGFTKSEKNRIMYYKSLMVTSGG